MEATRLSNRRGFIGLSLSLMVLIGGCAESEPLVSVFVSADLEQAPEDASFVVRNHKIQMVDVDEQLHEGEIVLDVDVRSASALPQLVGSVNVPPGIYNWVFVEPTSVESDIVVNNVIERTGLPPLVVKPEDNVTIQFNLIVLKDPGADTHSIFTKGAEVIER